MKRTAALVLATALFLSACIPVLPSQQQPDEAPAVDAQATDKSLAATLAVETLNALPTPTLEPATNTSEPTVTGAPTATATETATTDPNATASPTGTLETSTAITGTPHTATVTVTGTVPTTTQSVTPTATETLYARFYGTLPPTIPFGKIKLINKSKAEVYISLVCTTVDGYTTILEYPVEGRMRVNAPAGRYAYVAWVGGKEFQGWFRLGKGGDVEITFEKNKVIIK